MDVDFVGGVDGLMDAGIGSIHFSWAAKSKIAFLVGSPAAKDGTVVDGGAVRMGTMSDAACL